MAAYGIPLVPWQLADRVEAAVAAAQSMGFPLAMKTANPAIIHKSDLGGVMLNLAGEAAVRDAYRKLEELGGAAVMVQKMAEPGLEWLVGGRQDEHFGPVLVVGMGGIYVEVLRETAIRVGPVTLDEAQRALDECRGAALLAGVRGQPPLDREALAELVVRVSWLLYDYPAVRELDLNPVRVFAAGQGACALDWRILVSRDGG
jgi:acetyltransferase